VIQNIPRGSLTMFIIEINTFDKSGQMVLAGKTTAILPNPGET